MNLNLDWATTVLLANINYLASNTAISRVARGTSVSYRLFGRKRREGNVREKDQEENRNSQENIKRGFA